MRFFLGCRGRLPSHLTPNIQVFWSFRNVVGGCQNHGKRLHYEMALRAQATRLRATKQAGCMRSQGVVDGRLDSFQSNLGSSYF